MSEPTPSSSPREEAQKAKGELPEEPPPFGTAIDEPAPGLQQPDEPSPGLQQPDEASPGPRQVRQRPGNS